MIGRETLCMGILPGSDPRVARSLSDPESVAAGLGYVTQAVLQLASILDVPLRYPVAPGEGRFFLFSTRARVSAQLERLNRGTRACFF